MSRNQNLVIPTRRVVNAWRMEAETAIESGVVSLGQFNWPVVILSLIAEWEKIRANPWGDVGEEGR